MRTSNSLKIVGGVAVAALLAASQANGIIAFDNTTGVVANRSVGGPYALGMEFTVNTSIMVTRVGAFDAGAVGFVNSIPVAIYNVANQQLVPGTSVTLSGTTWDYTDGSSRFMNLSTPVTLGPGTYSIVAANYAVAGGDQAYWYSSSATQPGFNDGGNSISLVSGGGHWASSSGLVFPTSLASSGSSPTFAAGTFDFTPVPEAAAFGAAGVGLLGLVYIGRYARLRRKTPA